MLKNFPKASTIILFHKECIEVIVVPHSHQHVTSSSFRIVTIQLGFVYHSLVCSPCDRNWLMSALQIAKRGKTHEGGGVSLENVIQKTHLSFSPPALTQTSVASPQVEVREEAKCVFHLGSHLCSFNFEVN